MGDFSFVINRHVGTLKEYQNGWTKEVNVVSWNGAKAKYDIRDWNPDHTQMTRGITLSGEEMMVVYGLLKKEYEGEER